MKLVVDMNLAPLWVECLMGRGLEAVHWSAIGDPRALDQEIGAWGSRTMPFQHRFQVARVGGPEPNPPGPYAGGEAGALRVERQHVVSKGGRESRPPFQR